MAAVQAECVMQLFGRDEHHDILSERFSISHLLYAMYIAPRVVYLPRFEVFGKSGLRIESFPAN